MSLRKSSALLALTQAALALPGVAGAAPVNVDYLFSDYQEQDVPGSQSASGEDEERYDIQSHLFRVVAPIGETTLGVNLTYETMSGASPWFITPGPDGRPMQVMSGASIREERTDVQATLSIPVSGVAVAATAGYSTEDDYEAVNVGLELETSSGDGLLTFSGGVGYSADELNPTVGPSSLNVIDSADKDSITAYGGVSYVIDTATVVQGSISVASHDGFLTDPYKLAWIDSLAGTVADSRPDGRVAWTFSGKLRHHFEGARAAAHLDYRYYQDDWEIHSHTVEASWQQRLGDSWRLAPAVRWYTQSRAFFYAPYYNAPRGDGFASSDYRLSPYGALSGRLDLTKSLGKWSLGAGVEYYAADADYALKSVDVENPALVEYLSVQGRVTYQF